MNIDELISTVGGRQDFSEDREVTDEAMEIILESRRKDVERKAEEIQGLQQDRRQRKIFSYCIFGFMCTYMAAAVAIVFLCGFGKMHLHDSVLITLLSTTLANVIGVFAFVAKYLFHK